MNSIHCVKTDFLFSVCVLVTDLLHSEEAGKEFPSPETPQLMSADYKIHYALFYIVHYTYSIMSLHPYTDKSIVSMYHTCNGGGPWIGFLVNLKRNESVLDWCHSSEKNNFLWFPHHPLTEINALNHRMKEHTAANYLKLRPMVYYCPQGCTQIMTSLGILVHAMSAGKATTSPVLCKWIYFSHRCYMKNNHRWYATWRTVKEHWVSLLTLHIWKRAKLRLKQYGQFYGKLTFRHIHYPSKITLHLYDVTDYMKCFAIFFM